MFLGILVGFDQQVDQAGEGSSIPQRGLVLWAQGQVADEADHSLQTGKETEDAIYFCWPVVLMTTKSADVSKHDAIFLSF